MFRLSFPWDPSILPSHSNPAPCSRRWAGTDVGCLRWVSFLLQQALLDFHPFSPPERRQFAVCGCVLRSSLPICSCPHRVPHAHSCSLCAPRPTCQGGLLKLLSVFCPFLFSPSSFLPFRLFLPAGIFVCSGQACRSLSGCAPRVPLISFLVLLRCNQGTHTGSVGVALLGRRRCPQPCHKMVQTPLVCFSIPHVGTGQ